VPAGMTVEQVLEISVRTILPAPYRLS